MRPRYNTVSCGSVNIQNWITTKFYACHCCRGMYKFSFRPHPWNIKYRSWGAFFGDRYLGKRLRETLTRLYAYKGNLTGVITMTSHECHGVWKSWVPKLFFFNSMFRLAVPKITKFSIIFSRESGCRKWPVFNQLQVDDRNDINEYAKYTLWDRVHSKQYPWLIYRLLMQWPTYTSIHVCMSIS